MFSKEYLVCREIVPNSFGRLTSSQQKTCARVNKCSLRSADSYWADSNIKIFVNSFCGALKKEDFRRLQGYFTKLQGKTVKSFIISKGCRHKPYFEERFMDVFRYACENGLVEVVKCLHEKVGFTPRDFMKDSNYTLNKACELGHLNIVRYLYEKVELEAEDFLFNDCEDYGYCESMSALRKACESGQLEIVKYFHETMGFTSIDFMEDDYMIIWTCAFGQLDVIKYLYFTVGLTVEDFRVYECHALGLVCEHGCLDVLIFLHEVIGITAKDFRYGDNGYTTPLSYACSRQHLDIVKYLHEKVGLTVEDFRARQNNIVSVFIHGYFDIIKYIHEVVGLELEFFRDHLKECCCLGSVEVIRYYHEKVGLTITDLSCSDLIVQINGRRCNIKQDISEFIRNVIVPASYGFKVLK